MFSASKQGLSKETGALSHLSLIYKIAHTTAYPWVHPKNSSLLGGSWCPWHLSDGIDDLILQIGIHVRLCPLGSNHLELQVYVPLVLISDLHVNCFFWSTASLCGLKDKVAALAFMFAAWGTQYNRWTSSAFVEDLIM